MPNFVLQWDKELGWKQNPFQNEIFEPIDYFFRGFEKQREELNLFVINQRSLCTITGQEGSGKTMLLVWLEAQLQNAESHIGAKLVRGEKIKTDEAFVKEILNPLSGGVTKLFSKLSKQKINLENLSDEIKERTRDKRYVLIVDNADKLGEKRLESLKELSELNSTQVILSTRESLKTIGKTELDLKLGKMQLQDLKSMMQQRIQAMGGSGIWPFEEAMVKEIAKEANNNPKVFLKLCQEKAIKLSIEVKNGKISKPVKKKTVEVKEEPKEVAEAPKPKVEEPKESKELKEPEGEATEEPEEIAFEANEMQEEVKEKPKRKVLNLGFIKIVKEGREEANEVEEDNYEEPKEMKVEEPEEQAEPLSIEIEPKEEKKTKKHTTKTKTTHKKGSKKDSSKEKELKKHRFVLD